jgi:diguanylate cyclase (GGDEF)-like protein
MTSQKHEELILQQNKKIIDLTKNLNEHSNFIWVIGEIVKYSGKLRTEYEISNMIIDILIGIFGLSACSLIIKQEDNTFNLYSVDNLNNNAFNVSNINKIDNKFLNIKEITFSTINDGKNSQLIIPVVDFTTDEISGFLTAIHTQVDFFNKTKFEFFSILSIQLSNSLMNSKLLAEISKLSSKDILTNCLNRRYLNDLIDYNTSGNVSYILFDLDNFKLVNDNYGHNKGDEVLIEISDLTISFFKPYKGRVVRYGGDEFIVILEMNYAKSIVILNEFRIKLLSNKLIASFPFLVSASFGIAAYPEHSDNLNDLLRKADKALYEAKENGKNQIKTYSNEPNNEKTIS